MATIQKLIENKSNRIQFIDELCSFVNKYEKQEKLRLRNFNTCQRSLDIWIKNSIEHNNQIDVMKKYICQLKLLESENNDVSYLLELYKATYCLMMNMET